MPVPGSRVKRLPGTGFFYAVNAVCTRKFGIHQSGSSLVFYPILTYLLFIGLL
jgi:hypothetical protein